jgi:hypothetical protein
MRACASAAALDRAGTTDRGGSRIAIAMKGKFQIIWCRVLRSGRGFASGRLASYDDLRRGAAETSG